MSLERTWAVVVNWNGGERNLACVEALEAAGVPPPRVVFVDNGSSDRSLQALEARYRNLERVVNPRNLGFGAAANQGARAALAGGARHVFFVNNDVVLAPDCTARLVRVLDGNPRVGLVGPRVLLPGEPPRLWAAGGVLTWGRNLSDLRGQGLADGPRWRATVAVDYVPGCALLARRELLEEVGLFEERYFAYMEDVELGLRAARAGWGALCVGEASCVHDASSATGGGYTARRKYMNALNAVHFLRAHATQGQWAKWALCDLATLPLAIAGAALRGRARAGLAKALGTVHGLLGRQVTAQTVEPGGTFLW